MKMTHSIRHRMIAYVVFISFLLQSCGGSNNPIIIPIQENQAGHPQNDSQPIIPTTNIKPLVDQQLTAVDGYLITPYEYKGELLASVESLDEKNKVYNDIPVVIEKGTDLIGLPHLLKTIQQNRIQLQFDAKGNPNKVGIYKETGLMGGMKRGREQGNSTSNQSSTEKENIAAQGTQNSSAANAAKRSRGIEKEEEHSSTSIGNQDGDSEITISNDEKVEKEICSQILDIIKSGVDEVTLKALNLNLESLAEKVSYITQQSLGSPSSMDDSYIKVMVLGNVLHLVVKNYLQQINTSPEGPSDIENKLKSFLAKFNKLDTHAKPLGTYVVYGLLEALKEEKENKKTILEFWEEKIIKNLDKVGWAHFILMHEVRFWMAHHHTDYQEKISERIALLDTLLDVFPLQWLIRLEWELKDKAVIQDQVRSLLAKIKGMLTNYYSGPDAGIEIPKINLEEPDKQYFEDIHILTKGEGEEEDNTVKLASDYSSISPWQLESDAGEIRGQISKGSIAILCVVLRENNGAIKKFVFASDSLNDDHSCIKTAYEKGYHFVNAQRSHAEGALLQFLYQNVGKYTHIISMGCDKPSCPECAYMMDKFFPDKWRKITGNNTEGPHSPTWDIPPALAIVLARHDPFFDAVMEKNAKVSIKEEFLERIKKELGKYKISTNESK